MNTNRMRFLGAALALLLAGCSSTDPYAIDVNGFVASVKGDVAGSNGLSVLVTDATFSNPAGLSSPIYVVAGPSTKITFSGKTVPASEIKVGAFVHAVVSGNVLDSQPAYIGADRIDIGNVVATSRSK